MNRNDNTRTPEYLDLPSLLRVAIKQQRFKNDFSTKLRNNKSSTHYIFPDCWSLCYLLKEKEFTWVLQTLSFKGSKSKASTVLKETLQ
ncbi:hypothetical protein Y1Q_0008830 [Alligator mississippiensis]|uniref:Uncharacterized protein n=1 Tax=Alligator mississippiensis TaxID=8496 RepID=A0A151NA60_ALLMI|nr:hypothetical protein Y1Q_0008830 [Alligator mississippiensis]